MKHSLVTIVSAVAVLAVSQAALAQDATAPASSPPATAAAPSSAQPRSQALLRGVIGEVVQGKIEFAQMTPMLRVNLMQQLGMLPALTLRLQAFGELQSVTYAGPQQGLDIYDVRFANASMMWGVGMADGRIGRLMWRFR